MVADISDDKTYKFLKKRWDDMSEADREKFLLKTTFSTKYSTYDFEDLTIAIQQMVFQLEIVCNDNKIIF